MPRYAITETAGRFVAGQTNTGVGSVLDLTEKQAAHEVRLGTLHPLDVPAADADGDEGKKATSSKGKQAAKAAAKAETKPASGEGAGEGNADQ